MADKDFYLAACRLDPVLQFIGEHHLCQLAVAIDLVRVIVVLPVHVVELDGFEAHLVAFTGDHDDPPVGGIDTLEQQPAQQEMPVVIHAQLTFETVDGELLSGNLSDGAISDEGFDLRDLLQHFRGRAAHAGQPRQIHAYMHDIRRGAKLLLQRRDGGL